MARPLELRDIAAADMGPSAIKSMRVQKMPSTRKEMCTKCPFRPDIDVFTAFKCLVLKEELTANPTAVWMCHETSGGGNHPTAKSIICRGAADWRTPPQEKDSA